ncbi:MULTISPECIES: helix-turn-helix transcriptional regulator [unclassified Butyrivibrio]|uniref:helix-turn-helix transcriptional regulator n=1 Tax=unclassified Butyrivibrio TaxID=2639466 RepID=UPI00040A6A45|nr:MULTISPECIES: helix-turn-helix transcriptional regulator [unclassified Butyrivibrio]SFD07236.1 hypothetical protein SAMN02910398_03966 [Butyrivibrio sp. YAB3001]
MEELEVEIISGLGLDILICIFDKASSCAEIASKLDIPVFTVSNYINKMVDIGIVKKSDCSNESIKYCYEEKNILIRKDLKNINDSFEKKRIISRYSHQYSLMVKDAVKNALWQENEPNRVQALFIKANRNKMDSFLKEYDELLRKYQTMSEDDGNVYNVYFVVTPNKNHTGEKE